MRFIACLSCIVLTTVFAVAASTAESVGMRGMTVACFAVAGAFAIGGVALLVGKDNG